METAMGPGMEPVPPEEVERRMAEYRAIGFKYRSSAIAVYREESYACPWADCDYAIKGIDFCLDEMGGPDLVDRLLESWWLGPGLVGPCPHCRRLVLFRLSDKQTMDAVITEATTRLPDDWHAKSRIFGKDRTTR